VGNLLSPVATPAVSILVLDDNKKRHRRFDEILVGRALVHAYSYGDVVAAYEHHGRFDVVFLDRDLSEKQECGAGGDEKTGEDVVAHIVSLPRERWPERAVIHSWNEPGAERMRRTFEDAGIPAVWLKFKS
jgi:CheY-like chemotaxis protein